jgi:hypothetical protein
MTNTVTCLSWTWVRDYGRRPGSELPDGQVLSTRKMLTVNALRPNLLCVVSNISASCVEQGLTFGI